MATGNQYPKNKKQTSRRSFVEYSASGLASAWLAAQWPDILKAQEHAQRVTASGKPAKLMFFSADQGVEIESITAQIIPADGTPGAREAGVLYFIDRALNGFDRQKRPIYTKGLDEIQTKTGELFPGAVKFSRLSSEQQIQVLKSIEKTEFFAAVRVHTVIGFFANPEYGGNQEKLGWKLIGFEDKFNFAPPFGHYDRLYRLEGTGVKA